MNGTKRIHCKFAVCDTYVCVNGGNMRQENDFYATPPWAVEELLDQLNRDGIELVGYICDPYVGQGHLLKVIQDNLDNHSFGFDQYYYNNIFACDNINYGVDIFNVNNIITSIVVSNPPYKNIKEHIIKCLEISRDIVILLLPINVLASESRIKFFRNVPLEYVYICSKRVSCWKNGNEINQETGKKYNGNVQYAWFIFNHNGVDEPIIRWIGKD